MARRLLSGIALAALSTAAAARDAPPPLDPAQVARGAAVYRDNCAACHGETGEGAPDWHLPDARGELPAPPHGPEGHTWRHSDADLEHMIAQGWRDPFNETGRLTMPAFGEVLAPGDIEAVVAFLKTLWTPEQRRFQWEESKSEPIPDATTPDRRPNQPKTGNER